MPDFAMHVLSWQNIGNPRANNIHYRILCSLSFKVLADKGCTCLTIQKCLAKDISPALHALMNHEHMVEAHDGLAVLDDVEASTFVGFCEFAYTGDYHSRMTEREPGIVTDDPTLI
jgi:hypothetical protein